jgi:uncharacterized membrane protein
MRGGVGGSGNNGGITATLRTVGRTLRRPQPPNRIVGIDLARAIALVGMIATHVYPPLDGVASTTAHQLFAGRASALFAVLAGVSLALVTGRRTPIRGRERLARSVGIVVRAALIFALGRWLADQESGIAIILQTYAVLFVVMLPFLGWRPRNLAALAAVWMVAGPFVQVRLITSWPEWDVAGWATVTQLFVTGLYPLVVWVPYFLVGVAVGRLDLRSPAVAARLAAGGAALAVVATVVSDRLLMRPSVIEQLAADMGTTSPEVVQRFLNQGLYGFVPGGTNWWLATVAPHSGTPFDLAHTTGVALGVIGACLLIGRLAPRLLAVLGGAGAITLTLYTVHVLMRTDRVWPPEDPDSFVVHVGVVLVAGALWRLLGRRGPLEWAVSWLSGLATRLTEVVVDAIRRPAGVTG